MQDLNYRESKQRGTLDFPIEFHHVEATHPQYNMTFHWHLEYEIIRILKGSFTVLLNETEFTAYEGDIILIQGGTLHAGTPDNCIYECIVFEMNMLRTKEDILRKYIEAINNQTILLHNYLPKESTRLHDTICRLFDSFQKQDFGFEMIVKGTLYEIFGTMLERNLFLPASLSTPYNQKRIGQLKQVLELMENQYHSTITLNQLSKAAGMSSKYFCQFFQEMTHKSPMDYLNYYRIECACVQLLNTDAPITEIALNCGFNDLSYFIKTFRRYKGNTPAKYRKQ